jgi:hypothetical protein
MKYETQKFIMITPIEIDGKYDLYIIIFNKNMKNIISVFTILCILFTSQC